MREGRWKEGRRKKGCNIIQKRIKSIGSMKLLLIIIRVVIMNIRNKKYFVWKWWRKQRTMRPNICNVFFSRTIYTSIRLQHNTMVFLVSKKVDQVNSYIYKKKNRKEEGVSEADDFDIYRNVFFFCFPVYIFFFWNVLIKFILFPYNTIRCLIFHKQFSIIFL